MAVSTTYVGGLCTNALPVTGGELQGDLSFAAGKRVTTDNTTAVSTAAAATISKQSGVVTTEALTTAAGAAYTFVLTNTLVSATSQCYVSVAKGSATEGVPVVSWVTCTANTVTMVIQNVDLSAALNGTIKIKFVVFN